MKRVRTEHEDGVQTTVFFDNDGNSLRVIMDDEGVSLKAYNGYGERMVGDYEMPASQWWTVIKDGGAFATLDENESETERYLREHDFTSVEEWAAWHPFFHPDWDNTGRWVDDNDEEVDIHAELLAAAYKEWEDAQRDPRVKQYLQENGYASVEEWALDSDYFRDGAVNSGWADEYGTEVDLHEQINAVLEGLEHDTKTSLTPEQRVQAWANMAEADRRSAARRIAYKESLLWPKDRFYIPCHKCGTNLDQVLANERALCVECERNLMGFFVAVRVYTNEDGLVSRTLHGPFRNLEEGRDFLDAGPDEKDLSEAHVWYVNPKDER